MAKKRRRKLRHEWLDANDEANTMRFQSLRELPGFWVPTPDDIDRACELLREQTTKADGVDERGRQRPPKQITPFESCKAIEEIQLCDCPYWETEFKGD